MGNNKYKTLKAQSIFFYKFLSMPIVPFIIDINILKSFILSKSILS
nr:MAG TPA: hypothetical protein [Caudoviricetes sp.]